MTETEDLRRIIKRMRKAFELGENVMQLARDISSNEEYGNSRISTLVAYDLQAGSYIQQAAENIEEQAVWCSQVFSAISPYLTTSTSILEVGVGEATTLSGVMDLIGPDNANLLGFDLSWSRLNVAKKWLAESGKSANLFAGDLFSIPLMDNSVDVVYSSHSLEPNGGKEREAIAECMRVARVAVVLVEPIYELASPEARSRMQRHGYVKGLRKAAQELGADVVDHRLFPHCANPLNPSGVIVLEKSAKSVAVQPGEIEWKCPLTGAELQPVSDVFIAKDMGIVYPILRGVPMLRPEHAIVASSIQD